MSTQTLTAPPLTTAQTPQSQPLLTVAQVCQQLGIDRRTLMRWWDAGTGPRRAKLAGGQWRVRQEWLDAYILDCEVAA